jgi:hypothetical protein
MVGSSRKSTLRVSSMELTGTFSMFFDIFLLGAKVLLDSFCHLFLRQADYEILR